MGTKSRGAGIREKMDKMSKIFKVDRFYNFFIDPSKKIAIISYEYVDKFGRHNITMKGPCKMVEFQSMNEEYLSSEYIYISSDVVDIGTKAPFPMIIRINRLKSERKFEKFKKFCYNIYRKEKERK
jgi:hypothetical protein